MKIPRKRHHMAALSECLSLLSVVRLLLCCPEHLLQRRALQVLLCRPENIVYDIGLCKRCWSE